jgi:hypothetical protein
MKKEKNERDNVNSRPIFRIPALLVLAILVLYTALGGLLMSQLEPWSFFTSFYWSFITMTTGRFVPSLHPFFPCPCIPYSWFW